MQRPLAFILVFALLGFPLRSPGSDAEKGGCWGTFIIRSGKVIRADWKAIANNKAPDIPVEPGDTVLGKAYLLLIGGNPPEGFPYTKGMTLLSTVNSLEDVPTYDFQLIRQGKITYFTLETLKKHPSRNIILKPGDIIAFD